MAEYRTNNFPPSRGKQLPGRQHLQSDSDDDDDDDEEEEEEKLVIEQQQPKKQPKVAKPLIKLKKEATKHETATTSDLKPSGKSSNNSNTKVFETTTAWSVREAAIELLRQRNELLYQSSSSSSASVSKITTRAKSNKNLVMPLSTNFGNIDTILLKLRRDKSNIIRKAFDGAAMAVLHATCKNTTITNDGTIVMLNATAASMKSSNITSIRKLQKTLPTCFELYREWDRIRNLCYERAHNNKEYNKRKGGKIEISTITAASKTSSSSAAVSATGEVIRKKPGPKPKNKNIDATTTANKDTATTEKAPSSSNIKKEMKGDDDDDDDDNASRKSGKDTSSNAPVIPKFTRNTPASSAAALDFRFNSSRAILCVAGNIVFDALTPPFEKTPTSLHDSLMSDDNSDMNERENYASTAAMAIDILDVPQNPINKKKVKKTKKGGKVKKRKNSDASDSDGNDNNKNDDNSDTEEDDVDDDDDNNINDSDNESTKSGSKKSSTEVNMGAVKVEAQLLAQRTIGVAQNAIHRTKLRYQYRRDNAKYTNDSNIVTDDSSTDDTANDFFLRVKNPFEWKPPPDASDPKKNLSKSLSKKSKPKKSPNKNKKGSFLMGMGDDDDDDDDDDEETSSEDDNDNIARVGRKNSTDDDDGDNDDDNSDTSNYRENSNSAVPYQPNIDSTTYIWQSVCLPRFLNILSTGAGHALYHDIQWSSRHGRIADLLRAMSSTTTNSTTIGSNDRNSNISSSNFGPHLIITTQPDLVKFGREFHDIQNHLRLVISNENKSLHALTYSGSSKRRTKLRTEYFGQANGLPEAPFHVLLTTYTTFFEDYIHFCQLPFETVILDDGVSFMAASCDQNNSVMGTIWDSAIFSSNDHHVGLAGTLHKEWDYSKGNEINEASIKDAFIGLTARHRIMTASAFTLQQRHSVDYVAISGLVDFIAPQFALVVKEEWARSRIYADADSMKHFRKLVSRSMIVHSADSSITDLYTLSLHALTGKLKQPDRSNDPLVPDVISDDEFVSSSKIAFSRRASLLWLGPPNQSWLRYELGTTNFQPILEAMKLSNYHGHFCEEIATASSTTATGANGQVAGTMAFRCGVRCGRHFGSEPGLRQHVSALHAPPGTWLCRTCGVDCITSQARTHHERSCGQPVAGNGEQGGSVGATPTVGQGASGKVGGVGKKKTAGRPGAAVPGSSSTEEKDPDGSFRVPGYRGVWVNKNGKHFVKINGERLTEDETEAGKVLLFDNIDDAARMHDNAAKKENKHGKIDLNFKPDGSRIKYDDINPASTSGLGGSAANVVPALSVINIKDLPPDVKPLLRDPRQTSRTGGNSKRHIYAYRGVCRQARKGHDRWQSQISFMGVNHYLGTFDSEWDAAAIYAWAHLILYGEEATKQAQKEGEEAAAAYEQEKRDIAAGKIPEPPPKPDKKKKKANKKDDKPGDDQEKRKGRKKKSETEKSGSTSLKKRPAESGSPSPEKRQKPGPKGSKTEKEMLAPLLANAVAKANIIGPSESFEGKSDQEMTTMAAQRIIAARNGSYCASVNANAPSSAVEQLRPSIPTSSNTQQYLGGALLLGLPPSLFGWDLQDSVALNEYTSEQDTMAALQLLAVEYDEDGVNEKFRALIQGTVCVIGSATQKVYEMLGLGRVPVGGVCGRTDCHIGGAPGSCSETAACIRYYPTEISKFQFTCLSETDLVTLNGQRLTAGAGWFPLDNEDICSVGGRVFTFILPADVNL